ncbi:FHA domain-containing protein [Plantibacter flavus]|uniref:FHA domain-containing protein n=1 Tax=Plantibacter flavus TaxID=150123 RepID=UPI003F165941
MYSYETEPAEVRRWLAIAAPGRLVLVDAQGDEVAAAAFAAALPADAPLSVVLDRLAAGGLASTPAFAAASWDDSGLTVIVRGLAAAVVSSAQGSSTVAGARATTWVEEHHAAAETVTLRSDHPNPTGVRLPIVAGAVWTTSISASLDATTALPGPTSSSAVPAAVDPSLPTIAPTAAEQLAAPPIAAPVATASSEAGEADEPAAPIPLPSVLDTQFFHDEDDQAVEQDVVTEPAADEGYDFLFGQTVLRPVGAAAVEEPGDDEESSAPAVGVRTATEAPAPALDSADDALDDLGDHDGHTIFAEDLAALRARREAEGRPAPVATPKAAPLLFLELPGGTRQSLASPVVLGRAPTVSQVPASVVPTLVTLTGDDISRSHIRVAVEGGTVVVTDLHSRNGTQVVLPGQAPQTLRAGEPTPVIVGTVIDLGGDVALRVREG